MNKYIAYIKAHATERDMWEMLAEESTELSHSALKVIRATKLSDSYTPVEADDSLKNVLEESMDVLLVMLVLGLLEETETPSRVKNYWKAERWAKRLGYQEEDS